MDGAETMSGTATTKRAQTDYSAAAVLARDVLEARRKIGDHFDPDLFADPALDILLDLFAASEEGQKVSVSSCCVAACVPATTALRWIGRLKDIGMIEETPDDVDRRRRWVAITPVAKAAMAAYLGSVSLPSTRRERRPAPVAPGDGEARRTA